MPEPDIHWHQVYWIPHLVADGAQQMALDDALLQWLEAMPTQEPVLIARTYCWSRPTVSLGVHQSDKSSQQAYQFYSLDKPSPDLVRRPTGGRAIFHGTDVSFAFATNAMGLRQASLDDSYCYFTTRIRRTLEQCGITLDTSCETDRRAYTASALCFKTRTPSDLSTPAGEKIAGSAQLRRHHGLLQHGAAFLEHHGVSAHPFDEALQGILTHDFGELTPLSTSEPGLTACWEPLALRYRDEAEAIRVRLATTSGSHLEPASD